MGRKRPSESQDRVSLESLSGAPAMAELAFHFLPFFTSDPSSSPIRFLPNQIPASIRSSETSGIDLRPLPSYMPG
jgi:hypothetical protein